MKTQDKLAAGQMKEQMNEICVDVSRVLKALAHPQRLLILCYLAEGEKTVSEIEAQCEASQSSVSQFLNRMRLEGLIDSKKQGQFVHYKIHDAQVKQLIRSLYKIFCKN
jgi:DNA-binding transcriptional ArsR family regulator